jgi:UDP-N-acetyl-L-fucosamine synthase
LMRALGGLAGGSGRRVIVTTHPRLRMRLEARGLPERGSVEFLEPFGFFAYNKLQRNATCVLSDSGTISEESAICGFPAVTIRETMERPEALDTGSMILTGIDADSIIRCVQLAVTQSAAGLRPSIPTDYQVLDCSARVSRLIHGLSTVHATWLGLRPRWRTES